MGVCVALVEKITCVAAPRRSGRLPKKAVATGLPQETNRHQTGTSEHRFLLMMAAEGGFRLWILQMRTAEQLVQNKKEPLAAEGRLFGAGLGVACCGTWLVLPMIRH